MHAPVVIVFRHPKKNGELLWSHTYISKPSLDLSEDDVGLYTWSGLKRGAYVGVYNGLREAEETDAADDRLMRLRMDVRGKPVVFDPSSMGSVMCLANLGHNDREKLVPEKRGGRQLMKARVQCPPHTEMMWDYNAVTSDPNDPLLKVHCMCCNPERADDGTKIITLEHKQ